MKQAEFAAYLHQTLGKGPDGIDPRHLEETCALARQGAESRRRRPRISSPGFFLRQVPYVGWKVWGPQAGLLAVLVGILTRFYGDFFWKSPQAMLRVLFCVSVLTAMTALPVLYRSVRWKMQEVEGATYFSSVRLLMAKLAVIGAGDLVLLAGVFAAALVRTSLQAASVSFYLYMPFLAVSSGCLFLLGRVSSQRFLVVSTGACVLLLVLGITLPGQFLLLAPEILDRGWLAVCGLLLIFCVYQLRYLRYRAPYGELQVGH